MKKLLYVFIVSLLFFSCQKSSEISQAFHCESVTFNNLEKITDVKNLFSVKYPKTWKTNLYYDDVQSSIYTADTTKQLTETILLDVTFINKKINFNDDFKLLQEKESLSKNLIQTTSKNLILFDKPSYYTVSKGKKGKFAYQVYNTFIKVNNQNFILAKTEIYGDSLVDERVCNAISLIEKINIINK